MSDIDAGRFQAAHFGGGGFYFTAAECSVPGDCRLT